MCVGLKYARWWRDYEAEVRAWREEQNRVVWKSADESLIIYGNGTIVIYGQVKVGNG